MDFLLALCLGPCFLNRNKQLDFKRWHCKMEHGFGFCFLIEYEDEMKKTLVTAGRRQIFFKFFVGFLFFVALFFCFFFLPLQEEAIVFEEIFSKYL